MRDRSRDRHTLLLSSGKFLRHMMHTLAKSHEPETFLRSRPLISLIFCQTEQKFHIFIRRHHRDQSHGLKYKSHIIFTEFLSFVVVHLFQRRPFKYDCAFFRIIQGT